MSADERRFGKHRGRNREKETEVSSTDNMKKLCTSLG
jgi:hypothetical protein